MAADTPLVTGEAVELELRAARLPSRLLGRLIDLAVQVAVLVPLTVLAAVLAGDEAAAAAVGLVASVAVVVGYPVLSETLSQGRTLGKLVTGLRVVRDDGGPIRLRHALVRALVGVTVDQGVTLGFGALVCSSLHPRGKRIGDVLAGTFAVQDRVPARVTPPAAMPWPLASWAATADLSGVTPELAGLARQLVARQDELSPAASAQLRAEVLAGLEAVVAPAPPPGTPGWAVVHAVLAERRRRDEEAQRRRRDEEAQRRRRDEEAQRRRRDEEEPRRAGEQPS